MPAILSLPSFTLPRRFGQDLGLAAVLSTGRTKRRRADRTDSRTRVPPRTADFGFYLLLSLYIVGCVEIVTLTVSFVEQTCAVTWQTGLDMV